MSASLKHRAINAASWRMLEILFQRAGALLMGIVLARLLLPQQFGLMEMLIIFTNIAQSFINAGFGSALIQRQNTTLLEESSVFYCNVGMSFVVYLVLFVLAPLVPVFYGKPELEILGSLLRVNALILVISSFSQTHATLLTRQLKFRSLCFVGLFTLLAQAISGIWMAYAGFGVWALVYSQIIANVFRTSTLIVFSKWHPCRAFSFAALGPLFTYGWKMLVSEVLYVVFQNLSGLLIGRYYSAVDLAYYNRGRNWPNTITQSMYSSLSTILFSVFSSVQNDEERMRRILKRTLSVSGFVLWPCLVGIGLVSESLVRLILTDKWLPAVPYMRVFCGSFCLYPLHAINLQILKAKGRSDLFLRLESIKRVVTLLALCITAPLGVMAIAWGWAFSGIVSLFLNTHYTRKFIGYSLWSQLKDLFPIIVLLAVMSTFVIGVRFVVDAVWIKLGLQVLAGGLSYFGAAHILKVSAYLELREILAERWHSIRRKKNET